MRFSIVFRTTSWDRCHRSTMTRSATLTSGNLWIMPVNKIGFYEGQRI